MIEREGFVPFAVGTLITLHLFGAQGEKAEPTLTAPKVNGQFYDGIPNATSSGAQLQISRSSFTADHSVPNILAKVVIGMEVLRRSVHGVNSAELKSRPVR